MSLKHPVPGLRTLHNGTKQVAKAQLSVPPGDTLQVSDSVADALLAARVGLTEGEAPTPPPPVEAEVVKPAAHKPEPRHTVRKKS